METDLKAPLVDRLKQVGVYDVRVAAPHIGLEHSMEGKHPLDFWPAAKSIVIYAVPISPEMNNTYIGPYSPWEGDRNIDRFRIIWSRPSMPWTGYSGFSCPPSFVFDKNLLFGEGV